MKKLTFDFSFFNCSSSMAPLLASLFLAMKLLKMLSSFLPAVSAPFPFGGDSSVPRTRRKIVLRDLCTFVFAYASYRASSLVDATPSADDEEVAPV